MGEARATSFPLPPGVRFYPSEEELVGHYLGGKNAAAGGGGRPEGYDLIGELDLYGYDPFGLPDSACYAYGVGGRKRHWFFYTGGGATRERGGKRKARNGFWMRKGRMRAVLGRGGRRVLGTRMKFVFYLGNSVRDAVRTNWVLYEYAPLDLRAIWNIQFDFGYAKREQRWFRGKKKLWFWLCCFFTLSQRLRSSAIHFFTRWASFVLCRVFVKSRPTISISENWLVSSAEESVSAVRHIGIQHDGDNISDSNDENEVDDPIVTEPAPMQIIQTLVCAVVQMDMDGFTADHLRAILNDNFLELNDLAD